MKKSLEGNAEGNQRESTLTPLATLLPKAESIQKEADSDSLDSCSVPSRASIKPEFLNWVIEKVKQFPKPPQFPRQAAIALIKRNRDEIEAEYEEWQAIQERNKDKAPTAYDPYNPSASSPAPPALRELGSEEERRAYKLAALQGMWRISALRSRAEQQCKEWDFFIGPEGPRELEF